MLVVFLLYELLYVICFCFFFFLMDRRPPKSTQSRSSAASDVYKRQGHERGVLNRKDFLDGLDRFIAVIDERDRKILSVLQKPLSLTEIAERGLIYGRKYHVDAWIYMWEFIMIRKHVQRMVGQGRILDLGDQLIAA